MIKYDVLTRVSHMQDWNVVADSLFVCFIEVYRPTRDNFTHMETSQLPLKGYNFFPMPGTHGY